MRKVIALFLMLSLALSPVVGTFAVALGSDGEHMHFDHIWHAVEFNPVAAHDWNDHHRGGPIKHSHADHVHYAVFLVSQLAPLVHPTGSLELATFPESFTYDQHPCPPLRPPQAA